MTWLVGNPRFSLVDENRFWLVNGTGPIRPWSDFVGCDHVSHGWEQWGVSIRVIGRMTSLEWFSIWEASNNIINFNDVRKRLWKPVKVLVTQGRTQKTHGENIITETLMAVPNTLTQQRRCYHATGHLQQTDNRPIWRHRHTWTSPQNMRTPLPCNTGSTTVTQPWYHDHLKWTTWNTYVQSVSKTSQQRTNIFHWENNHPVDCEMEMQSLWNGFRQALWTLCP